MLQDNNYLEVYLIVSPKQNIPDSFLLSSASRSVYKEEEAAKRRRPWREFYPIVCMPSKELKWP